MPILLIISVINTVRAQEDETFFGFQVSPAFTSMDADDNLINGNGTKVGIKLGGLADYYIKDWLILNGRFGFAFAHGGNLLHKIGGNLLPNSELSDSQLNTGTKPLPDDVEISYRIQLLEMGLGLKYLIPFGQQDFDLLLTFPSFDLGIVGQTRGDITATGIDIKGENLGKDVSTFNLAWHFGGGIQRYLSGGQLLQLELLIQRGLADLTKDDGVKAIPNGTSFDRIPEDSKGHLNAVIIKFALLF